MEELKDIQNVFMRLDSSIPICRICLEFSMEYIEFESPICVINGEEITYSEAFDQVSSYAYDLPDKIPTNLCCACGNDLLNTYLFLKRVENSNCILENVKILELKSLTKVEEKVPDIKTEFVESLKVEILNDPHGTKYLDLWTYMKLENHTESENVWCSQKESSSQKFLDSKANSDNKSICLDTFDTCVKRNNSSDNECVPGDENGDICESKELLEEHYKKHEIKDKSVIICSQCDQTFLLEDDLHEHLLYHQYSRLITDKYNNRVYNCILCKKNYMTEVLFANHMNGHTGHKTCKVLTVSHTENNPNLYQWRENRSDEENKRKLQHHRALRRPSKSRKLHIKKHMVQINESSGFICDFCGKKCLTAMGLKSHSRVHKESKFICHICSKICSTESTLKRHIEHIHLSDHKKYQCEHCGLVFKYPSYLKDHQRKHNSKTKYKCPFCERSYCRKPQFDIHLRYHNNDFRHKCSHCNKGYATKSNLTDHIKSTHIKITYDCDKCDQRFKSITGLKKHKYSHTGYPYNCPLCLLGQASRSGIKTHIFGVHRGAITTDEFNKMFPLIHPKSGYRRPKVKAMEQI